jgi:hypothetical protein
MNIARDRFDTSYEWKAVTLLTLGFGLVGLDRWIIAPLFPSMMKDLNLNYQDMNNIVGALGLSWGIFAIWPVACPIESAAKVCWCRRSLLFHCSPDCQDSPPDWSA